MMLIMKKQIFISIILMLLASIFSGCTNNSNQTNQAIGCDYVENKFVNVSMETVDFSEEIADNGSVYYKKNNITYHYAEKKVALTIINNQSTYSDVWLLFYKPGSNGEYGLCNDLETDTISVFCKSHKFAFYGCNYSEKWDKEHWNWIDGRGCYNDNWLFVDRLSPGSIVVIPITFYIDRSYAHTFRDGEYYTTNAFWLVYPLGNNDVRYIMKFNFEIRT